MYHLTSITTAEFWGIRAGLLIAWQRRVEKIIVETDSTAALQLINRANTSLHPLGHIIEDCRELLNRSWDCSIIHTYREDNHCANFLANMSLEFSDDLRIFEEPPSGVLPLLLADAVGTLFENMEGEPQGNGTTVCVTGASGFIGSWLSMRLLERGYYVRATVRDPGNMKKVKHLLELPNASTHLSLWRGDLIEEGSFDNVIQGCTGVFHVATPMDFTIVEDEDDIIKPTVNGILNIMRSCSKSKSVKRIIYTSTTGTVVCQPNSPPEYDETHWTDVDFVRARKMTGWMYFIAKTMAEKAAWEFAKENGLDLVTVLPSIVIGPFLTPFMPLSVEIVNALITENKVFYPMLIQSRMVNLEDVCNAHIYLFEHPQAKGRYICSSHTSTIIDLARSLSQKYPEYNIPPKFDGVGESLKAISCSTKRLLDLGFTFKYNRDKCNVVDMFAEVIELCREKGLLPLHGASQANSH